MSASFRNTPRNSGFFDSGIGHLQSDASQFLAAYIDTLAVSPVPEHALYLAHGDERQEAREQEEGGEEEPEAAEQGRDLDRRRGVHRPARRQEVAVQRGDDDDEALDPHADVDQQR